MACANQLKAFLVRGGTVYACPGRYVGNFEVGNGALIGAGQGADPAASTIITALHGLRITGGNLPDVGGGGLYNNGTTTFDSASSITGNSATGTGGGIFNDAGTVTLGGATVSGNTPDNCVNVAGC